MMELFYKAVVAATAFGVCGLALWGIQWVIYKLQGGKVEE